MSTGSIGYVETIREDLLDAGWRSTVAAPTRGERLRRGRFSSTRWLVAAATSLTLISAGIVGWLITGPGQQAAGPILPTAYSDLQGQHRAQVASPSPAASQQALLGLNAGALPAGREAFTDTSAGSGGNEIASLGQKLDVPASINPVGDLSKVIKTAQLSIVVGHDTFGKQFNAVGDIADRLGGYLQSSSTQGGKSGSAIMRLPAKHFQAALSALRKLGRVDSESVQGQDVTAQYVDLSARLDIAKARRRVLFGLMKKAVSIPETITVQNALDDVQLRIESLQGEINVLNDRVSQATIRISMREVGVKPQMSTTVSKPSIPNAFDRAVAGFVSVVAGVIVGLGWVLPSLAVLLALGFIVVRVRRRFA